MKRFLERRMKKVLVMSLVLAVFLAMTFAVSEDVQAERFSPWAVEKLIGKEAPVFSVKDLSGKRVSLSYLNTLHRDYKDRGLRIVSVSTDRSADKVKSYAKKTSMDFIVLHDTDREAASRYGVYSLPVTFLIDRNGVIQHKVLGLRNWTDSKSKKLIEKILKD
jgi:peroxiredoxin